MVACLVALDFSVVDTYQTRSVAIPDGYHSLEKRIRSREKHLDVLSVAFILVGVFYVLYGLAVAAVLVLVAGTDEGLDPQLRIVLPLLAIGSLLSCLVMSGWFFITAWGLHRRMRSGRISSYVLSVILLLTLCMAPLGVYALWALIGKVTDMAFGIFEDVKGAPKPSVAARSRERSLTPLPPSTRPRRAGIESYPRPPVAATTPPMGVPRHQPSAREVHPVHAVPQADHVQGDIASLPTVQDLPSPCVRQKR